MAVVRCRECGGEVSTQAAVCPHCGIGNPAMAAAGADVDGHARGTHVPGAAGVPVVGGHDHVPARRRGGKGGWILAMILLLILLALFGLWYGNIVDFN